MSCALVEMFNTDVELFCPLLTMTRFLLALLLWDIRITFPRCACPWEGTSRMAQEKCRLRYNLHKMSFSSYRYNRTSGPPCRLSFNFLAGENLLQQSFIGQIAWSWICDVIIQTSFQVFAILALRWSNTSKDGPQTMTVWACRDTLYSLAINK
jgi:hypothetical protein